jgi:hypothetical protein
MKYLINVISHIGCTIVGIMYMVNIKTSELIQAGKTERIEELYEIYVMLSNTEEAEKYRQADMIQSYSYFEESASNLFETYKKNNNV